MDMEYSLGYRLWICNNYRIPDTNDIIY